jgi:hypothetical protein
VSQAGARGWGRTDLMRRPNLCSSRTAAAGGRPREKLNKPTQLGNRGLVRERRDGGRFELCERRLATPRPRFLERWCCRYQHNMDRRGGCQQQRVCGSTSGKAHSAPSATATFSSSRRCRQSSSHWQRSIAPRCRTGSVLRSGSTWSDSRKRRRGSAGPARVDLDLTPRPLGSTGVSGASPSAEAGRRRARAV